MENKYYIPTIEEFCIGFEYEELCKNPNWHKLVRPVKDVYEWISKVFDTSTSFSTVTRKIKEEKIRVKYLDKQDICGLGVSLWQIEGDSFEWEFYMSYKDEEIGTVCFNDDDTVSEIELFGRTYQIKNKYELKKIMNQLRIYESNKTV